MKRVATPARLMPGCRSQTYRSRAALAAYTLSGDGTGISCCAELLSIRQFGNAEAAERHAPMRFNVKSERWVRSWTAGASGALPLFRRMPPRDNAAEPPAAIAMDTVQVLKPATARMVFRWQMAFLAVLLSAIAISDVFTSIADRAYYGVHVAPWEPITWEFSSIVCLWLLVPAIGWWLKE